MVPNTIGQIKERIRNVHPRTRKAQFNTFISLLTKGGGILISLLLVPLTIDYLSKSTYGIWLTISSIVTMIALFDIGIGNGLRNRFSEAVSNQNSLLARAYVSTAYVIFSILQLVLVLIFLLIFRFIPWDKILNTKIDNGQLQLVVLITLIAISVKLVLDILSYTLFALQESGRVSFMNFMSNALILVGTFTLTKFSKGNLIYLGLITAVSPILVLLISSIILYKNRLKIYRPSIWYADFKYAKNLLSLGYKFFVIQMAVIVVFYTDNLIITHLFGPAEVTTYNVSFRYFNAINTLFAIAVTPYWSAFTEAFAKQDNIWMKSTYNNLRRLWFGLVIVVAIMIVVSSQVYKIWIGNRVIIPQSLSFCTGLFVIVSCWNSITVVVANGLGKVHLQLIYALIAAIVNVPLAIILGKGLNMGSTGVILATTMSLLIGSLFGELQAQKLLSGRAKGIWNR